MKTKSSAPTDAGAATIHDLLKLEHESLAAYDAAVSHFDHKRDRSRIAAFMSSHHRHIAELARLAIERGEAPMMHGPIIGDVRTLLQKGKVALGVIAGEHALLMAMKTNADGLVTAYQRALVGDGAGSNPRERVVLERALDDERKQSDWLEHRMGLNPVVGEEIMAPEGENERASRASIA